MFSSAKMGDGVGGMFRYDLGTRDDMFIKMKYLPYRVPDEAKVVVDSVCDMDTSHLLNSLGVFKLCLIVPMLTLGIILISVNSQEVEHLLSKTSPDANITQILHVGHSATHSTEVNISKVVPHVENKSLAPVWTGLMLASSAATDFIAVWRRQGFTIIMYMFISTLTFVASILCIEYDRLAMEKLAASGFDEGNSSDVLKYNAYLACVVLASIAVATSVFSMYVGSRMAGLEESRLYMAREGKEAVLKKSQSGWKLRLRTLKNFFKTQPPLKSYYGDSSDVDSRMSPWEATTVYERKATPILLSPDKLGRNDMKIEDA